MVTLELGVGGVGLWHSGQKECVQRHWDEAGECLRTSRACFEVQVREGVHE